MPTFVVGNLWDELGRAGLLLVPTNNLIRNGRLVMGAGAALEARRRFPTLPEVLAAQARARVSPGEDYLLLPGLRSPEGTWVGAFQTKRNPLEYSDLALIAAAARRLAEVAPRFERIAMAYPGIGLGRLSPEEVAEVLKELPEYVMIYRRGIPSR